MFLAEAGRAVSDEDVGNGISAVALWGIIIGFFSRIPVAQRIITFTIVNMSFIFTNTGNASCPPVFSRRQSDTGPLFRAAFLLPIIAPSGYP